MTTVEKQSMSKLKHCARADVSAPSIMTSIPEYPVTVKRQPYINTSDSLLTSPGTITPAPPSPSSQLLTKTPGTARANIAPTRESPAGTVSNGYPEQVSHRTVLQQHCDFFDTDGDDIIWPSDTYCGFRALGFNVLLSFLSMVLIHANFSYPTVPGLLLPDPYFRIYLARIHKNKHGSDTGAYDGEGRFVPQRFEDFWSKYSAGEGKDTLTAWEVFESWRGLRCIADPVGWMAAAFEWAATYLLFWPEDGLLKKKDVRGVYDGSVFYEVAEKRTGKKWKNAHVRG